MSAHGSWWRPSDYPFCQISVVLRNRALPTQPELARYLPASLRVGFTAGGRPLQSQGNCGEIAVFLADLFGFTDISMTATAGAAEFRRWVVQYAEAFERGELPADAEGEAFFVFRRCADETIDGISRAVYHISFEYRGREFNYGATGRTCRYLGRWALRRS